MSEEHDGVWRVESEQAQRERKGESQLALALSPCWSLLLAPAGDDDPRATTGVACNSQQEEEASKEREGRGEGEE